MTDAELTPGMIEAGKAAMIAWYEGGDYFDAGAEQVFRAMMAARKKRWKYGQMTPKPFGDGIVYGSDDGKNWIALP